MFRTALPTVPLFNNVIPHDWLVSSNTLKLSGIVAVPFPDGKPALQLAALLQLLPSLARPLNVDETSAALAVVPKVNKKVNTIKTPKHLLILSPPKTKTIKETRALLVFTNKQVPGTHQALHIQGTLLRFHYNFRKN
jgi:hypothetical protein